MICSESRFYGLGNYYLSSIQQGIQSAHVISELFLKYPKNTVQGQELFNWAENHKTMVLLNGGNSASLADFYYFLDEMAVPYPFASFNEDEQSLNGALTYVGIILPKKVYDLMYMIRKGIDYDESDYEVVELEVANKLHCYSLAI